MPYRRSFVRRRRFRRPVRFSKKTRIVRRQIPRMRRPPMLGIHFFKRTVNLWDQTTALTLTGNISLQSVGLGRYFVFTTGSVISQNYFGSISYEPNLSNLPAISELSSLFDNYKLSKVVLKLIPYATSVDSADSSAGISGGLNAIIHSVFDVDGSPTGFAGSEAGIASLQQYPNYKKRRLVGNRPLKYVFVPRPQIAARGTAGSTTFVTPSGSSPWLDMSDLSVPHYGFYAVIESVAPSSTQQFINFRMEAVYYFKCKGVR